MFNTLGYKHLLRGTKWGGGRETCYPQTKMGKELIPHQRGGGEYRCLSDITDLQLTKQNKQVPPRDEQERCHDTNELRSHSHDQGDSYWDFYGRRQMDQANVKW